MTRAPARRSWPGTVRQGTDAAGRSDPDAHHRPGGLVEQWQDELATKFGITAELLSREMITSQVDSNPFTRYPILIARMDQLARNDDLLTLLDASDWDLIVVDEAHRMSANYYSGELDTTRRYQLGQRLGAITRHLLLMTATPCRRRVGLPGVHGLLDPDRFEGEYRSVPTDRHHRLDAPDGQRGALDLRRQTLFPERIAETVPYQLSDGERTSTTRSPLRPRRDEPR